MPICVQHTCRPHCLSGIVECVIIGQKWGFADWISVDFKSSFFFKLQMPTSLVTTRHIPSTRLPSGLTHTTSVSPARSFSSRPHSDRSRDNLDKCFCHRSSGQWLQDPRGKVEPDWKTVPSATTGKLVCEHAVGCAVIRRVADCDCCEVQLEKIAGSKGPEIIM